MLGIVSRASRLSIAITQAFLRHKRADDRHQVAYVVFLKQADARNSGRTGRDTCSRISNGYPAERKDRELRCTCLAKCRSAKSRHASLFENRCEHCKVG